MMARPSAAARNLSLTEELERLEQSITLTLQGTSGRPLVKAANRCELERLTGA